MKQPDTKGNLLVVDDTRANLRLLVDVLTKQGYRVRAAPNGRLALATIATDPPDLVLLDISMPDMDGYEVCQRMKADPTMAGIPIIFISAMNELVDKVKAFSMGGVDYITKPFQLAEVIARVETHMTIQQLQESLRHKVKDLEQANAELDAYARTVAHDLKNPLSNMVLSMDLIKRYLKDDVSKVEQIVDRSMDSSYKMIGIIETLLLLAGVRKKTVKVHTVNTRLAVSEAKARLRSLLHKHEGEIILPQEWPSAQGYQPWIEEVWANYLSNGIKYGGRPFRLELGAYQQDDGMVRFWVRDNGQGISDEQASTLFDEFTRLNHDNQQGHGLGLSIVHRIITKLGGQVGVDSLVGEGSTFYFTLPQDNS